MLEALEGSKGLGLLALAPQLVLLPPSGWPTVTRSAGYVDSDGERRAHHTGGAAIRRGLVPVEPTHLPAGAGRGWGGNPGRRGGAEERTAQPAVVSDRDVGLGDEDGAPEGRRRVAGCAYYVKCW